MGNRNLQALEHGGYAYTDNFKSFPISESHSLTPKAKKAVNSTWLCTENFEP